MFETVFVEDFLDPATRRRILSEMQAAAGAAAGVYGLHETAQVETRVRNAQRLTVSGELRELVASLLARAQDSMARDFAVHLTRFEEPQFLRYAPGDFFVAHQDGNTALIPDDTIHRRVSVVIFLSSPSTDESQDTYAGGSLVLYGRYPNFDRSHAVPAKAGALVAFRSETTHEVKPVSQGERYTIVSWYRQ
jgi:SM-20-related protein